MWFFWGFVAGAVGSLLLVHKVILDYIDWYRKRLEAEHAVPRAVYLIRRPLNEPGGLWRVVDARGTTLLEFGSSDLPLAPRQDGRGYKPTDEGEYDEPPL